MQASLKGLGLALYSQHHLLSHGNLAEKTRLVRFEAVRVGFGGGLNSLQVVSCWIGRRGSTLVASIRFQGIGIASSEVPQSFQTLKLVAEGTLSEFVAARLDIGLRSSREVYRQVLQLNLSVAKLIDLVDGRKLVRNGAWLLNKLRQVTVGLNLRQSRQILNRLTNFLVQTQSRRQGCNILNSRFTFQ